MCHLQPFSSIWDITNGYCPEYFDFVKILWTGQQAKTSIRWTFPLFWLIFRIWAWAPVKISSSTSLLLLYFFLIFFFFSFFCLIFLSSSSSLSFTCCSSCRFLHLTPFLKKNGDLWLVSLPPCNDALNPLSHCAGVSLWPAEGLGHQQHQHEAVRQPHAHADGRQAQVQATVQEGGVGHAPVLPLLHLPAWGKGHVSPTPAICYSFSLDGQQPALFVSKAWQRTASWSRRSGNKAFVVGTGVGSMPRDPC